MFKSLQEFHLAETGFELAPSYSTCLEQLQSDTKKAIVNSMNLKTTMGCQGGIGIHIYMCIAISDIFTIRLFNTKFQREKAIFILVWFSKKDCWSLKKCL